ncbi:curli production assembly/transport protein CsgE, partial [Klebsiella pneumoniae]
LISESAWEEMTCLFAPSLKDMTKICVVLDSDNAQQWDTFFENNVQNKG